MNYNNIFAFIRQQKAFTAFMTTLVVLGSFSAVFAARGAQAETVFTKVTNTLSKTSSSTPAIHTIKFTPLLTMGNTSDLDINFNAAFTGIGSLNFGDVAVTQANATTTYNVKNSCDSNPGTIRFTGVGTQVTLSLCSATYFTPSNEVKLTIGGTNKIINPATSGSYDILLSHPASQQSQKIRVAILPKDTLMTAKVDPIFTFTVASTTASSAVNGTTTTFATGDSAIDFGTLVPGVAAIGAQKLTVSTNAVNGFTVSAQTDDVFRSANGATIDAFNNGATSSAAWAAPTALTNDDKTWGHIGMTYNPYVGSTIGSNQWVGNFVNNPVTVMSFASSTKNASTTVGFQAQISDLQEAATDYKTNVIYVATPVF